MPLRKRSVRATAPILPERVTGPVLLDPEEVGVQRLAAVVHLGLDVGVVLLEPLGDVAGAAGRRAVALDDRDQLVAVVDEVVEQLAGSVAERRPPTTSMPSRLMPSQSPSAMGPASQLESRTAWVTSPLTTASACVRISATLASAVDSGS